MLSVVPVTSAASPSPFTPQAKALTTWSWAPMTTWQVSGRPRRRATSGFKGPSAVPAGSTAGICSRLKPEAKSSSSDQSLFFTSNRSVRQAREVSMVVSPERQ